MLIVRTYRWRMYNAIHEKYGKKWNEGKGTLTPDEAQEIVNLSSMWDMPLLMNRALSFSLFKTFAIVGFSISDIHNETVAYLDTPAFHCQTSSQDRRDQHIEDRYKALCRCMSIMLNSPIWNIPSFFFYLGHSRCHVTFSLLNLRVYSNVLTPRFLRRQRS